MHWCFACVDYVCHVFACFWRPKVGVRLSGAEVQVILSYCVGTGNEQILLTTESFL